MVKNGSPKSRLLCASVSSQELQWAWTANLLSVAGAGCTAPTGAGCWVGLEWGACACSPVVCGRPILLGPEDAREAGSAQVSSGRSHRVLLPETAGLSYAPTSVPTTILTAGLLLWRF